MINGRLFRNLIASAVLALALPASPALASYIDSVTSWEWRNLSEAQNLSWLQVDAVCANDGVTPCDATLASDGALGTLTGWTWGTTNQVMDLLRHMTGLDSELDDLSHTESGDTWSRNVMNLLGRTGDGYFFPDYEYSMTRGWSAESYESGGQTFGVFHTVALCEAITGPTCVGKVQYVNGSFGGSRTVDSAEPTMGVWLHRPSTVTAVPEPASVLLVVAGLAGLAAFRRRRCVISHSRDGRLRHGCGRKAPSSSLAD